MTKQIPMIKIKDFEREYLTDNESDDDEILMWKDKVRRLNRVEKVIFLLYIHHSSLRKIAKLLNVSLTTAHKRVKAIREKLLSPSGNNSN